MTKQNHIYLFELNPLRESDEEILAGLSAIHDEIVRNGNAVVLTYEQLIDSRVFFSLMADRAFYQDAQSGSAKRVDVAVWLQFRETSEMNP